MSPRAVRSSTPRRSDLTDAGLVDDLDAAIDTDRLVADACRLVRTPSVCGCEAAAQEVVADLAAGLGLQAASYDEDLTALRAAAGYPGEEVARDRLVSVTATAPGSGGRRMCLNGHVDVVPPGDRPWATPPFAGLVVDGRLHGRGAVDMKAGLVASIHGAAAAVAVLGRLPGDVVVHSVAAEEDGGLGAFALLRRDRDYAGCVIAEPTDGAIVCAQAGALTWHGRISGRSAHGASRLDGVSAIDRYVRVHAALHALEAELNAGVDHPVMRTMPLPYPLSVGRVGAGDWPSTVPDELVFEGRVGVPLGCRSDEVRARFEACVQAALDDGGAPAEISWTGGQYDPGETAPDDPLVTELVACAAAVTGRPPALTGAPYGSDLRLYGAAGVPAVLFGPGELGQAHATDEAVALDDVVRHARVIARLCATFGAEGS